MKIVIVDDNQSIRKVLRAICEGEGHEVVAEFGDGTGLVDFVKAHRPDIVCLDYDLPGANGLELLVELDVSANRVDVVMITGSEDPELKGHAADFGATGFILKPFEESQIVKELRDIAQTRAIKERAATAPEVSEPEEAPVAVEVVITPGPAGAIPEANSTSKMPEADAVPADEASSDQPGPPHEIGAVPRSAVIIDDSGSIRLLLKGILQEMGIKVIGFGSSGREGIEVVGKTRPALVCLDVDMPGMTGLEALPQIRATSPQTKVVMITGNASRTVVAGAVAGGAKGYFLKPIRPAKVEAFIRKLLQL